MSKQQKTPPIMRYRTFGGGVVTWTHRPADRHGGFDDWGSWTCNGCGDGEDRAHRNSANEHARTCHAIPATDQA